MRGKYINMVDTTILNLPEVDISKYQGPQGLNSNQLLSKTVNEKRIDGKQLLENENDTSTDTCSIGSNTNTKIPDKPSPLTPPDKYNLDLKDGYKKGYYVGFRIIDDGVDSANAALCLIGALPGCEDVKAAIGQAKVLFAKGREEKQDEQVA